MAGVIMEEDEVEMGADDVVGIAAAATRLALLRFPGTLPIRDMEKTHLRRRFEHR
jgi:hypothetical protein